MGAGSTWAANDAVASQGRRGEMDTATILNQIARVGGPTVLHDLRIPIPGFTANIDHAVVAGNRIWLIDSKRWKPAFYWTVGGKTHRGIATFAVKDKKGNWKYPAASRTMPMAVDSITKFLTKRNTIRFSMATPLIVVWASSSKSRINVRFLKMPGSHAVSAVKLKSTQARMFGSKRADPQIVAALAQLVVDGSGASAVEPDDWG